MEDMVKDIIAKEFNIEASSINKDTSLINLVQDSLAMIEILFQIEESVGVHLSNEEVFNIETVGDLINCLKVKNPDTNI